MGQRGHQNFQRISAPRIAIQPTGVYYKNMSTNTTFTSNPTEPSEAEWADYASDMAGQAGRERAAWETGMDGYAAEQNLRASRASITKTHRGAFGETEHGDFARPHLTDEWELVRYIHAALEWAEWRGVGRADVHQMMAETARINRHLGHTDTDLAEYADWMAEELGLDIDTCGPPANVIDLQKVRARKAHPSSARW